MPSFSIRRGEAGRLILAALAGVAFSALCFAGATAPDDMPCLRAARSAAAPAML